jgi:hypothetical protein
MFNERSFFDPLGISKENLNNNATIFKISSIFFIILVFPFRAQKHLKKI